MTAENRFRGSLSSSPVLSRATFEIAGKHRADNVFVDAGSPRERLVKFLPIFQRFDRSNIT